MFSRWTTDDIPLQVDRVAVVTGANAGIGYVTARELARKGAQVVLACRDPKKATAALEQLRAEVPGARVGVATLDLSDLASVRAFAASFAEDHDRLDLLVNNAGIMRVPEGTTADGFERQIGTNHLGHFALTGLLLPLLRDTPASRVVTVSSIAHKGARLPVDDLMMTGSGYDPSIAYGRSKLANLLFAYELDRRLRAAGADVRSVAAHPGVAATNLFDHLLPGGLVRRIAKPVLGLLRGSEAGAQSILRAATDPTIEGGQYVGPRGPGEAVGAPEVVQSTAESHDEDTARALWAASEDLTDVRTDLPA